MTVVTWLAVLCVVVLGVLLAWTRQQLARARAELGEHRGGRAVVVVDVRNADELAAQRTRLARALSLVAPGATRALVHRELVRQLGAELSEQGVDADVLVRRLPQTRAEPTASPSGAAEDPAEPDGTGPGGQPGPI